MNMLRGTILSVLLLCFVLAISTAFANGQDEDLAYETGEVQEKLIRYEKPQVTAEVDQKKDTSMNEDDEELTNEDAEEATNAPVEKPYYYLIVNKTPYLADKSDWESVEEGHIVTLGYEEGNVHVVKTIDEE
ncbi:hypothetical protein [Bacillus sp. N1-1]|jgi:hypothetical protein|uniref:hypothetical protein n=1 Tax=Bacillus sp. N1-1 TaxID=2682541 RepID=UPI001318E592|nr:hypothetical protein [Bacillus sp. N1-1]QHA92138.1 hypothetical protein GNK04_12265 [Bacillus sp. N1-1]